MSENLVESSISTYLYVLPPAMTLSCPKNLEIISPEKTVELEVVKYKALFFISAVTPLSANLETSVLNLSVDCKVTVSPPTFIV